MFSMCSELTPCARIPDTRIPQFMQPWLYTRIVCLPEFERAHNIYSYLLTSLKGCSSSKPPSPTRARQSPCYGNAWNILQDLLLPISPRWASPKRIDLLNSYKGGTCHCRWPAEDQCCHGKGMVRLNYQSSFLQSSRSVTPVMPI